MPVDSRELRNCLGHFATGVTVVTCLMPDGAHGITVNAFSAVSLDPPLVLASIDRRSKACGFLEDAPFTVNVLSLEDQDHAMHFAGRPDADLVVRWIEGAVGPRLDGAVAYFACTPWANYDGGDHVLFLGQVEEFAQAEGQPLLFHGGRFRRLGDAVPGSPWVSSLDSPDGPGWLGEPPNANARRREWHQPLTSESTERSQHEEARRRR